MKRLLLLLAVALWTALVFTRVCHAHNLNNGYSYVRVSGNVAEYELLLPFPILLQYDTNEDKRISDEELAQHKAEIEAYMGEHLLLINGLKQMDFEMLGMQATIQEETEDPVVRFVFRYTSESEVEDLTIRYNVILDDVDPTHQNYIQLYQDGVLVAHRVVEKDASTFRYTPGGEVYFGPSLLGKYALLGLQYMLRNVGLWLFLLCLALPARDQRTPLRTVVVFAAANMIGYILAFRTGRGVESFIVTGYAAAMIGYFAIDNVIRKTLGRRNLFVAIFGLLHGLGTLEAVFRLGIYREYKVVSLAAYSAGLLAGLAGVVYVLCTLLIPLNKYAWYRRIVVRGSFAVLLANVVWLVGGQVIAAMIGQAQLTK